MNFCCSQDFDVYIWICTVQYWKLFKLDDRQMSCRIIGVLLDWLIDWLICSLINFDDLLFIHSSIDLLIDLFCRSQKSTPIFPTSPQVLATFPSAPPWITAKAWPTSRNPPSPPQSHRWPRQTASWGRPNRHETASRNPHHALHPAGRWARIRACSPTATSRHNNAVVTTRSRADTTSHWSTVIAPNVIMPGPVRRMMRAGPVPRVIGPICPHGEPGRRGAPPPRRDSGLKSASEGAMLKSVHVSKKKAPAPPPPSALIQTVVVTELPAAPEDVKVEGWLTSSHEVLRGKRNYFFERKNKYFLRRKIEFFHG